MTNSTYYEARVLLAALDGDTDEMARLIADMLPGERRALIEACGTVAADAGLYCAGCEIKIDAAGPFAPVISPYPWHPECAKAKIASQDRAAAERSTAGGA